MEDTINTKLLSWFLPLAHDDLTQACAIALGLTLFHCTESAIRRWCLFSWSSTALFLDHKNQTFMSFFTKPIPVPYLESVLELFWFGLEFWSRRVNKSYVLRRFLEIRKEKCILWFVESALWSAGKTRICSAFLWETIQIQSKNSSVSVYFLSWKTYVSKIHHYISVPKFLA
jgi:hypothetical protein